MGGYLVAYLNLDKVIKIIRNEDEPKPVLMKTFKLSDVQADAILNMRLRNLRRLEEIEIRKEDKDLRAEKKSIEDLIRSEKQQWKTHRGRNQATSATSSGRRRRSASAAPALPRRRRTTRPPSRRPWSSASRSPWWFPKRAGSARCAARSRICPALAFKADDGLKLAFFAETTSKLMVFATNGRFYTIDAAKLPGGRGHGEPMRLFIELEQEAEIVECSAIRAAAS